MPARSPKLKQIYRESLTMLTDFYQLTMAYAYWKSGKRDQEAVFHLFFRSAPFNGGFTVACGLEYVIDFLSQFKFLPEDLAYLATLKGRDGKPLFEPAFLDYLKNLEFNCDLHAVPEGTIVFAHEPLLRVQGNIIQCQLLETALLNFINFQTLIATKSARICLAAKGSPVIEFGLRRAQGIDGALAASRAAFVGGVQATSNVLAGKLFGIPVTGTHAHSWVMSFDSERESFEAYARAMPNNCIFLVDTYDTIRGVEHAIEVGKWLRDQGHELIGVRLDSGDLAYLSVAARKLLDDAGFKTTKVVATNDLDENIIESLGRQESAINVWGVGTRLATAFDQPALGGVYKLSAVRFPGEAWQHRIKLSEQNLKISTPGIQQVRRFIGDEGYIADVIFDEPSGIPDECVIIDPLDMTRQKRVSKNTKHLELLVPIFKAGKLAYEIPRLEDTRTLVKAQLENFHSGIKRFVNPHRYPVGLEKGLYQLKTDLILKGRGVAENGRKRP